MSSILLKIPDPLSISTFESSDNTTSPGEALRMLGTPVPEPRMTTSDIESLPLRGNPKTTMSRIADDCKCAESREQLGSTNPVDIRHPILLIIRNAGPERKPE